MSGLALDRFGLQLGLLLLAEHVARCLPGDLLTSLVVQDKAGRDAFHEAEICAVEIAGLGVLQGNPMGDAVHDRRLTSKV